MTNLLEALMILCFGLSWPISIYRSYVARTAKGKSLFFEVFLWVGYVFGIIREFMQYFSGQGLDFLFYLGWVFYFLNITEITIDMLLYLRNAKLDKQREEQLAQELEPKTEQTTAGKESE
ncbi:MULTISPECIES: hypothetical protein [Caproicibacterium]|uniref:PQ-loop repeat-containing protein n=1 Tax=Caproicibacterium argilliputei TaxID=3030016 RepID=A0AA97H2I1_9FIRM|nr:hypothetical protein [Caproicibacterium argilliputei]WOC32715.1 hypothetical protein PXC00_02240 [Caproicibacterium argilliputei]